MEGDSEGWEAERGWGVVRCGVKWSGGCNSCGWWGIVSGR